MPIIQLLNKGFKILANFGNAALEAELLLAYSLGVDREYLLAHGNEEVEAALGDLFFQYLQRRRDGEPLAYIIGEKEFFGLNFFVDKRVLIPRPETELLVEKALGCCRQLFTRRRKLRILDIGTGSGNIAVALAKSLERSGELDIIEAIEAVDIDEGALEVARINVQQHDLASLIQIFQSDLLGNVEVGSFYDLILANLPYIGSEKNNSVAASVRRYEPSGALFSGFDGLDLYKKLFQQLYDKNVRSNFLLGEFGYGQSDDLSVVLSKSFERKWRIWRDLAGIERIFMVYGNFDISAQSGIHYNEKKLQHVS